MYLVSNSKNTNVSHGVFFSLRCGAVRFGEVLPNPTAPYHSASFYNTASNHTVELIEDKNSHRTAPFDSHKTVKKLRDLKNSSNLLRCRYSAVRF